VSASGSQKKHNFGQILTIWGGSCTVRSVPLLPMRVNFSALEQIHSVRLRAKFRLNRFILSSSGGEKPEFVRFFDFGI